MSTIRGEARLLLATRVAFLALLGSLVALLAMGSCGNASAGQSSVNDTVGVKQSSIRQGTFDTKRKAVARMGGCSGTFVTPRLFLTAAHCTRRCPTGGPFAGCNEYSGGATRGYDGPASGTIAVADRFGCNASDLVNDPTCFQDNYQADYVFFPKVSWANARDVAIFHVTRNYTGRVIALMDPDELPAGTNLSSSYVGDRVTIVGFSSQQMPDSRRREGTGTVFKEVNGGPGFEVKALPAPNAQHICSGDSGGPALFDVLNDRDFHEKVGGVTSTGACGKDPNNLVNSAYIPKSFAERVLAVQHSAYLGCFRDQSERDLPILVASENHMTPMHCVNACQAKNFNFAGVQYGRYCFCGASYGDYGQVPDGDCNTPCTGDNTKTCGGGWRNAVYAVSRGCYKDSPQRDLADTLVSEPRMTVPRCIEICNQKGFAWAGVQFSLWCACGDSFGSHGTSNRCTMTCAGASDQSCGGRWASDIFAARIPKFD